MSDSATFKTSFTDAESFDMTFSEAEQFATNMTEVVQVTTNDHTRLINRDADDQHPIKAITDLRAELSARPDAALTNWQIEALIGGE